MSLTVHINYNEGASKAIKKTAEIKGHSVSEIDLVADDFNPVIDIAKQNHELSVIKPEHFSNVLSKLCVCAV